MGIVFMNICIAGEVCAAEANDCYSNLQDVLECFVNYQDNAYSYTQDLSNRDSQNFLQYNLSSQIWPIHADSDIEQTLWKHKLSIYIPDQIINGTALLFVTGGYTTDDKGNPIFSKSKESLSYADIANNSGAVVAVIEDVPNQFLKINGEYKKEDQILAFTYKKVMQDPIKNAYLAGHLPMAKSIIKAMNAVQDIMKERGADHIDKFILAGASKRGWAVWLASIADERVSAIIPIVIDILNVQENIIHICDSYDFGCPPALRDYRHEGIIPKLNSVEFQQLMQIEDPYQYLNSSKYNERLAIPKYIINSSGDDFYVADSSKFYFKNLPGENFIRFLPRAMHYLAGNPLSDIFGNLDKVNEAITNYIHFFVTKDNLPEIKWDLNKHSINVETNMKPEKAILWSANNEKARDFRCLSSYDKIHVYWKIIKAYFYKYFKPEESVCDAAFYAKTLEVSCKEDKCFITSETPVPAKGWQASFIEVFYKIDSREFVVTTEMLVEPE